jgi:signal transduction histidine kinase
MTKFSQSVIDLFDSKQVNFETIQFVALSIYIARAFAKKDVELTYSIESILIEETKNVFEIFDVDKFIELSKSENNENFITLLSETDFSEEKYSDESFANELYGVVKNWGDAFSSQYDYYSINDDVVKLIITFAQNTKETNIVYNPFGGIASFSNYFSENITYYGEEIEKDYWKLAQLILLSQNKNSSNFVCGDSFKSESLKDVNVDLVLSVLPIIENNSKSDSEVLTMQLETLINSLSDKGEAIFVLPTNFYGKKNQSLNRKIDELFDNRQIRRVVALPKNSVYNHRYQATLVVLTKEKNTGINFIDATTLVSNNGINIDEIISLIDKKADKKSIYVEYNSIIIKDNIVNLLPWRYVNALEKSFSSSSVKLKELLLVPKLETTDISGLKIITSESLSSDSIDFYIDVSKLNYSYKNIDYRKLNTDSVVIDITKDFRARLILLENKDVLVDRKLFVFEVDQSRLNVEYLMYRLHSASFINQLKIYSEDNYIINVEIEDVLESTIPILPIHDQLYWVEEQKQLLLSQAERENQLLKDKLGLQKTETQILSTVKHSVNQIVGAINSEYLNLKMVIANNDKNEEITHLSDKVSKRKDAKTVVDVFDSVKTNLNSIKTIFTTMQKVINIDEKSLNLQAVSLKELLIEEAKPILEKEDKFGLFFSKDNSLEDDIIYVDTDLFREVLRNLISNAVNHSQHIRLSFLSRKFIIGFHLSTSDDGKYYIIDYKNNGKPFPDDFSFDDYISYGKKFDSENGTGLGGFIINKVIRKHSGSLVNRSNAENWICTYNQLIPINNYAYESRKDKMKIELMGMEVVFEVHKEENEESSIILQEVRKDYKLESLEISFGVEQDTIDFKVKNLEKYKRDCINNPNYNEQLSEKDMKYLRKEGKYCKDIKGMILYKDVYNEVIKEGERSIQKNILNLERIEKEIEELKNKEFKVVLSSKLIKEKERIEQKAKEISEMKDDIYDDMLTKANIHFQIRIPKFLNK